MLTTRQRLILAIPLVVAVAAGVALWFSNQQGAPTSDPSIIEAVSPVENSSVLQQSDVSIDLQSGWDASLVINGRPIPDEQLTKVAAQGRVIYQPAADKTIPFLQAGRNCVTATYFPVANPDQRFTKYWCFTAA